MRRTLYRLARPLVGGLVFTLLLPCSARAAAPADAMQQAKALFFDRNYAEARAAWQRVLAASSGAEANAAAYWIARCSESLEEDERAFHEYGDFLERRPRDTTLVEEARRSRVGLAASLYRAGRTRYLPVVEEALADAKPTLRYFAAFELARLGAPVGNAAVPVLVAIVRDEKDPDLVDRARLALLRLDPEALAEHAPAAGALERAPAASGARWVKIRLFKAGREKPELSLNMPLALADLVFKALPEDARRDLRKEGIDVDNFWARLKEMPPMRILEVEGGEGARIQIWIE
jgi:hypothetical protein